MRHRTTTTLLLVALMTIGVTAPARAGDRPRVDLRGTGVGTFVLDDLGTAHLSGSVTGQPFDGTYTATLAAVDGRLPEPGVCEPARATLHVYQKKGHLVLAAGGEVCGRHVQAPYVVTHAFTGRYLVTDSSRRKLQGTDGWMSQILATGGLANVEAIDT